MASIPATIPGRLAAAGGYSPDVMPYVTDNTTAFSQNLTYRSLALQNFINLLLTVPGERIMDMGFGVGLKRYLFEMNVPDVRQALSERIKSQAATYLPYIIINDMAITQPVDQPNTMKVEIVFTISTTDETIALIIEDAAMTSIAAKTLTVSEAGKICAGEVGKIEPEDLEDLYIWDPVEAQLYQDDCEPAIEAELIVRAGALTVDHFDEPFASDEGFSPVTIIPTTKV
jgi:phage baseplate assembly protein W